MSAVLPSAALPPALDDPGLFRRWVDPGSGVPSYILRRRVAPLQQSFYFVNPSLTADGRHFWFTCAFPPSGQKTLGLLDLVSGEMGHFPDTQFDEASPCVDPATGRVYWSTEKGIWARDLFPGGDPILVNRFPTDFLGNRRVWRYATHLTLSADRRALGIDAEVGNDLLLGRAPLDGSPIEIWQTTAPGFNHGQLHPTDPDLLLLAQDHYVERTAWTVRPYENRLWTIRRGESLRPVYPRKIPGSGLVRPAHHAQTEARRVDDCRAMHGHEWWSADGKYIWYLHYGKGVERVALGAATPELVWSHPVLSHAHADAAGRWLVADALPSDEPAKRCVLFRNLAEGTVIPIVSHLPDVAGIRSRYHVHPHPQFCPGDRLVCYTTTVLGTVDIAFCRIDDLLA